MSGQSRQESASQQLSDGRFALLYSFGVATVLWRRVPILLYSGSRGFGKCNRAGEPSYNRAARNLRTGARDSLLDSVGAGGIEEEMGLWSRLKRSLRALFGGIVEKTEDPELILQQTIRDMRDRVPELNNSVAQVMATEKLLAQEQGAARNAGRRSRFEDQSLRQNGARRHRHRLHRPAAAGAARSAKDRRSNSNTPRSHQSRRSRRAITTCCRCRSARPRRCSSSISRSRRSCRSSSRRRWRRSISATMLRPLTRCARRSTAAPPPPKPRCSSARLSVDTQMQDIEREAMDMQLQDKLLEYKREMGLLPSGHGAARRASGAGRNGHGPQRRRAC